jgi:cytochrome c553
MKILGTVAVILGLMAADATLAQEIRPEVAQAAARLAATTCSTCHGTAGRSNSPNFPNLAAQTALYLDAQLKAFRDQTRADPDAQAYMWGMASQLSDEMIAAIAAHYAVQTGAPGQGGDAGLTSRGKVIFQQGVPDKAIVACATCHGDHAQGNGPIPRLAGQHAAYLLKQMLVIQSVLRLAPVMHGVIKDLSREQMQAVAAYLESLGP